MSVSFNPQYAQQLAPYVFESDEVCEMPLEDKKECDFVTFCRRLSEILENTDDQYSKAVAQSIKDGLEINHTILDQAMACRYVIQNCQPAMLRIAELDLRGLKIENLPVELLNTYFQNLTKIYLNFPVDVSDLSKLRRGIEIAWSFI